MPIYQVNVSKQKITGEPSEYYNYVECKNKEELQGLLDKLEGKCVWMAGQKCYISSEPVTVVNLVDEGNTKAEYFRMFSQKGSCGWLAKVQLYFAKDRKSCLKHFNKNISSAACYGAEQKVYTTADLEQLLKTFQHILVNVAQEQRSEKFSTLYWWGLGHTEYNEPSRRVPIA